MFGFFIDQTDGTTERNSETILNSDIRIHKYQASAFADKHSGGASFISNATYIVRLDSTDVNTPGPLKILCHKTSCLPVMMEFNVLTEAAWANKYGTPRYATNSMLTSTQTNVDSVLGTLNSVKLMTSATYTYGALTSQLTSVQTVADSVLGTVNSVKAMTSNTYTYGALTSRLTSVQVAVDSAQATLGSMLLQTSEVSTYGARASQLTSVQIAVDATNVTAGSIIMQTSRIDVLGARTSQLTSVQLAVDAGGATITPSDVWGYSVKALTDSVARTSQLTSVQLVVDAGGAGVTTSQIWEYSNRVLTESVAVNTWAVATRSLTDSVARASQLTSVQTVVDSALGTINSVKAMTSNTYTYGALTSQLGSVQTATDSTLGTLNSVKLMTSYTYSLGAGTSQLTSVQSALASTPADVWAVGTRSLTDSVARTSQLTSVQLTVDSVLGTTNSVKIMASATYSFGALTSQLTSVQTKVDTLAAGGDATLANQTSILLHLTDIKGATWAAATDSLEAIRDRGDAAWITGSGLTGVNTVTLTIKDDSALNVVQAGVCVYDSLGTTFYEKKFSNSSGQATFQMDDGTYVIKVNKAGYTWANTTLIVAGATSKTITGTASVITPPADPTLCRIGIYMKYQDGTIPATIESKLEVVELPDVHGNIGYMGTAYDGTYSATTGFLYWDVIQGSIAKLYILDAGIDGTKITIPATATAEIEDLI